MYANDFLILFVNALYVNMFYVNNPSWWSPTAAKAFNQTALRRFCYFGAPDSPLNGFLDDVMFFGRSLANVELQTAMNYYQYYHW